MPFTGFTQKLPSYELILPQSKQEYTVRTMLVKEEEILKGSYMTEESVSEHINKTIFIEIFRINDAGIDIGKNLELITATDIVTITRCAVADNSSFLILSNLTWLKRFYHAVFFRLFPYPMICFNRHRSSFCLI